MYSKPQAIAVGVAKLYEIVEQFDEALALINVMDAIGSAKDEAPGLDVNYRIWSLAKAFADKVYAEEAREIVNGIWDGSVIELVNDFWARPSAEILERMAAARWANSLEGISDLRRFWGVNPRDVTTDELAAFCHTLPVDSSSTLASSPFRVPMDMVIEAQSADLAKLRLRQASGKSGRLPDHESTVSMLKRQGVFGPQSEIAADLIKKERQHQLDKKKLQQQRD